ncbi:hypothetical protein MITSMUL_04158 [Mitsuokella multacida DSM 20544]|uniref:Uncharacterized protein n=1 Tax=Mitsuokella multacida DSM 20544 TaxID=500635 RepID=C9KLS4_9FIRM|nr:hypothetical protein MITSMUL_04158 [Mitsuokella multacida DSM 20544]
MPDFSFYEYYTGPYSEKEDDATTFLDTFAICVLQYYIYRV